MNQNNIIKIIACISFALFVWMLVNWQSEKQHHKFDKKISDDIIKQRYIEFAQKELQAKKIIKQSESKYDSIYKLHLVFESRYKNNNSILKIKVHEIKTLNVSTRSRFVDERLKFKGIRSENNDN